MFHSQILSNGLDFVDQEVEVGLSDRLVGDDHPEEVGPLLVRLKHISYF
jgi:hypothetical protein